MRNLSRTLGAGVFAAALMISAAGCKKKVPVPSTPPPPTPTATTEPGPAAPLAVRINSFTGEPRSIERGQSATLRWSVGNSTDISLDQGLGAVAANGSRQVFPSQTTTYTLTAKGGGTQDTRSVTIEVSSSVPPPPPPVNGGPRISGAEMLGREAQDVYFAYDKNDINAEGRDTLTKDADLIKRILAADPGFNIVIEGHCDERGSEEYNLALGDRRALAVKEFLVQLGVPSDHLKTISFGKERPVCTDETEACYQRNRRGHLAPAQ